MIQTYNEAKQFKAQFTNQLKKMISEFGTSFLEYVDDLMKSQNSIENEVVEEFMKITGQVRVE